MTHALVIVSWWFMYCKRVNDYLRHERCSESLEEQGHGGGKAGKVGTKS